MSNDEKENAGGGETPPEAPRPPGGRKDSRGDRRSRGLLVVAVVLATLVAITALSGKSWPGRSEEVDLPRVAELLLAGRLDPGSLTVVREKMVLRARVLDAKPGGSRQVSVLLANDGELEWFRENAIDEYNRRHGTQIYWRVEDPEFWEYLIQPLIWLAIFVALFYFLFLRRLGPSGAGGNILGFSKSRARLATSKSSGVTFADVAGIEEAKQDVLEIIEFLRNPGKFQRLGGRMPRGVLLVGHPGTGKTLLAKAIAGEANVPFFSISGSDFVEMFVGVGAARVRDLFKQARENSPCILFLDEVDAVGRRRGTGLGGGHDEREQTLNAILVEMDGFDSDEGIVVVASTNRPDVLDPALLRPGRFDRSITIDLPDLNGREAILKVHVEKIRLAPTVNLRRIARASPGFSGAELAALVNEGAILAAMKGHDSVEDDDLEEARDKIRWGRQKAQRAMEEEDRRIIAYHEAGHALVAHLLPEVEPLHKVTIIPRGMSLGATMQLPEKDRHHVSRKEVLGSVALLYAGRIAEEMFCGDVTAGAKSDIERATNLVRQMVCEWGMSELGPVSYTEGEETLFLGREVTRTRSHSEHLARKIDEEVLRIITHSYERAEELLRGYRAAVERIAKALLARETLSGPEVADLVGGESPVKVTSDAEQVQLKGPAAPEA